MLTLTALAGALLVGGGAAHAQDTDSDGTVDIELFKPYTDHYGYFSTPSAATLGHLQLGVGLHGNYSTDSLILVNGEERVPVGPADGDVDDGVVDSRFVSNFTIGMGATRFFSLTADIPLLLAQGGYALGNVDNQQAAVEELATSGIGDIRFIPKFVALDRDSAPIGVAVLLPVGLPTGNGSAYFGEDSFTFSPTAVVEMSDGAIHQRKYKFRSSIYGGYHVRRADRIRDVRIGSEFVYGIGVGYHPIDALELVADFHGGMSGGRTAQNPAEALLGTKLLLGRMVAVDLGGGMGLLPGIGAPDFRVIGGVSIAPSFDPNARDSDKDGIVDGKDRCVNVPEDLDGFQDDDGCPDKDNDVDGIPDESDECINDPEDDDGWMDNDGCPDPDNDKDGILDVSDRCPNDAETVNGMQDDDGCPDEDLSADTDGDGYVDDVDRCPYDAEDFDQFQDEDGCPDNDNDNDGVPDAQDQCPTVREVFNGIDDHDGCPDEGRVVVEASAIKILDKIYFETGKAIIQDRSSSLIDEIAAVIVATPKIKLIRIEGHTDNVGGDVGNLKLSQSRAESVRSALVQRGVDMSRLDARGFGEMYPVSSNDSSAGRAENRRVEFIIVDQE